MHEQIQISCFYTHCLRYSAQHYLQATCQFVVNDCANLLNHATDPDTIVDWDVVEQVTTIQSTSPLILPAAT